MDMNVAGALSAYAYQSTLTQTGNASQALRQGLAASQSQAASTSTLLASAGSIDPMAALAGGSGVQALASLAYTSSAASGNGTQAVQAMLASLGSSSTALFASSDKMPLSAAAIAPGATEALARYAYDQSADPKTSAQQAAAAAKQALLSTGLDLLA
jgi:hypothetical protein